MGKGSGNVYLWISYIKKGKIILEINNVSKKLAVIILKAITLRFPIKVELVKRDIFDA
jgi:ribosomal protein L16/L10AE